ncbi:MAG: TRAP transporter substrate-binding protein DctP [Spirochaetia bacterium]
MRHRAWMALLLLAACSASAGALTIKLGTLAPVGSPWEVGLRRIAAEWDKLSGGSVTLRIYAGGIAGDEPDMVRKMRIGTLNAAGITVSGLQGIFKGFKTLSYPLLVRNDGELSYVLDHMKPFFEQELEKRGFHAVMWSPGGWVYLFSRKPVVHPQDLKSQKLWVWSGDADEIQAYQRAGFQTVTLAVTDLMTSLQGGMIDALVTSPLLAASNQWFGVVSNMSTIRLGPLWGATLVTDKVWSEVPSDLRPKLMDAAQKIADSLAPDLVKADDQAIGVMKKYGLTIDKVDAQTEAEWADLLDRTFSGLVGTTYDKESFEMARKYLNEYLATHPRP